MVYRWEKNRKKTCQEIGRVTKMAWHGLSRSKWLASLTPGDWANQAPSKWDGETDVETRHPSIRDLISSFFQEKEDAFRVPSLSHHYAYLIPSRFLRRLPPRFVLRQYSQSYSQSRFSARSLLLFFFSSWRCRVYTSRNASQVEKRRQRTHHHHHPRNGRHVSSHDNSTQKLWK